MPHYMCSILNKWKSSDGQSCAIGEDLNEPGRSYVWLSLIVSSFNRFFPCHQYLKPIQESISIQRQRHPTFQLHLHICFIKIYPTKKNTISDIWCSLKNLSLPKRQVCDQMSPGWRSLDLQFSLSDLTLSWCKKKTSTVSYPHSIRVLIPILGIPIKVGSAYTL